MLQHATLELRRDQVEACLSFYRLLGFEQVEPPPSLAGRTAWLQRGASQIHLMWVADPVALPSGHVAVVDDYDTAFAALERADHAPERRTEHWGSPRAYVRDPAGNLVEVMAYPPV